jgi:hypothetical protein
MTDGEATKARTVRRGGPVIETKRTAGFVATEADERPLMSAN